MSSSDKPAPHVMEFAQAQGKQARRLRAAQLIEAVLDEQIEPRIAINRWPESDELADPSLDCAYQALWHFEADGDKQQSELFYMDAQLELLRQIATSLAQGQDLPPYILRMYHQQTPVRFFYNVSFWQDSLRFFNRLRGEFSDAWQRVWTFGLSLLEKR